MRLYRLLSIALALLLFISIGSVAQAQKSVKLSNAQMENLVRRSYQYVAMFNVNSKGALDESNPMSTHGSITGSGSSPVPTTIRSIPSGWSM
jgi:predicted secreted Zn-dependent protease